MRPSLGSEQVFATQSPTYSPTSDAAKSETVAVVVTHGMGQQVPYETIEAVAYAVLRGVDHAGATSREPVIRYVRLGTGAGAEDPELMRAEFDITAPDGIRREVHIYEAYWAPLTEGKVTAKDVITFLFNAGFDGITNTEAGTFKRWMFGREQFFKLKRISLTAAFVLVMALLGALLLVNAVVIAAAASHAIGSSGSFPAGPLLLGLTWDLIMVDLAGFIVAIGIFFIGRGRRPILHKLAWLLVALGATAILYSAVVITIRLLGYIGPVTLTPARKLGQIARAFPIIVRAFPILVLIFWALEFLAARWVRLIMIEYVGDVAAYVAAHTVSKFWDLRQQIWQTCMRVARPVYRARKPDSSAFLYKKIIMVGHSLGSVIAYDMLNGLVLEEEFSSTGASGPLSVAHRTRMFLTFGSPLDKTAFVFRTQKDMDSPVREVAAAAVQPMISDYKNRPQEWVNLWSRSDIISGNLDYYDPPNQHNARKPELARTTPHAKAVQNRIDPAAHTPLVAHVEYWRGALFASELYRAITT